VVSNVKQNYSLKMTSMVKWREYNGNHCINKCHINYFDYFKTHKPQDIDHLFYINFALKSFIFKLCNNWLMI